MQQATCTLTNEANKVGLYINANTDDHQCLEWQIGLCQWKTWVHSVLRHWIFWET